MGESALKNALQQEGQESIRALWREAEEAVRTRREQIAEERAQQQKEADRTLQTEIATLHNTLLFTAKTRARACRLKTEAALENRLLSLADTLLADLGEGDRVALWKSLCAEIPEQPWAEVRIHPRDAGRARKTFPSAAQETDPALGGGLIVRSKDSRISVDNSLGCRLRRAWPDLLPKLIEELRALVDDQ